MAVILRQRFQLRLRRVVHAGRSAGGSAIYNYAANRMSMPELPGISVFYKDPDGNVYHTYSCYARGLDMLNTAYHYLDLVPKGRDERACPTQWPGCAFATNMAVDYKRRRISDELHGDSREAGRIPEPNRRHSRENANRSSIDRARGSRGLRICDAAGQGAAVCFVRRQGYAFRHP